jgi:Leucine-rich repeat (LRR) protein
MTSDISIDEQRKPARRRWLRFGLRTLFVVVAGCSGIFALWRAEVRRDAREQAAVAELIEGGLRVRSCDSTPMWLRRAAGQGFSRWITVTGISFSYCSGVDDARLMEIGPALEQLPNLEELDLSNSTITDEGLKLLDTLKALKRVVLVNTPVTEAGIEALRRSHQDLVVER